MFKVVMKTVKLNNRDTILLTSEAYLGQYQTSVIGFFSKNS